MIAIIDYDAGNLKSVQNALKYLGHACEITNEPEKIFAADRVILPGVGSFGAAMKSLRAFGLDSVIAEVVQKDVPFLGICLGLQLLFEQSAESPRVAGLSLLLGQVKAFPLSLEQKVPHMGWNSLSVKRDSPLFRDVGENPTVYFVHSFYVAAKEQSDVLATTEYIHTVDAAVNRGNLYACQFHPEKSGELGLSILNNFCAI